MIVEVIRHHVTPWLLSNASKGELGVLSLALVKDSHAINIHACIPSRSAERKEAHSKAMYNFHYIWPGFC